MRIRSTCLFIVALLLSARLIAGIYPVSYIRDTNPWGQTTNNAAMDSVFGFAWNLFNYSNDPTWAFNPGSNFVFLEGSDSNSAALQSYLITNQVLIEDWVNNGGRLFINVSPSLGTSVDLGFDTTIVHYPTTVGSSSARAFSMATAIFSGPWSVDSFYTGNNVSRAYITGDSLVHRMYDDSGRVILAYKGPGCGIVVFGALSQPTFWTSDSVHAQNLFQNIVSFAANTQVCPLAIRMANIAAVNSGSRNRVDWKTSTETAGDAITIMRSADGLEFTPVATMPSKGSPSSYIWWDEDPVKGNNYYRLKLTDVSGKVTYSSIVHATVKTGGDFVVDVYPNPVLNTLTVNVRGTQVANGMVTVTDIMGKVMIAARIDDNNSSVDMSSLSKGVYIVRYSDDLHSQTFRVTK